MNLHLQSHIELEIDLESIHSLIKEISKIYFSLTYWSFWWEQGTPSKAFLAK